MVTAGTFISGLFRMLGRVASVGTGSTILSVTVVAAAIGLPVTVLVHAAGRFVLLVVDTG